MKKLPNLIYLPNANLRKPSHNVNIIDANIKSLVEALIEQAILWEDSRTTEMTVGLAAIQIDQPWNVVIVRQNFDNNKDRAFMPLINPKITKYEGEIVEDFEGCLSVKKYYSRVPRYTKIRLKALNIDNQEIHLKADGFLARVLQHEVDHLKGIMTVDGVRNPQDDGFRFLNDKDELAKVSYKDVKASGILLDD